MDTKIDVLFKAMGIMLQDYIARANPDGDLDELDFKACALLRYVLNAYGLRAEVVQFVPADGCGYDVLYEDDGQVYALTAYPALGEVYGELIKDVSSVEEAACRYNQQIVNVGSLFC